MMRLGTSSGLTALFTGLAILTFALPSAAQPTEASPSSSSSPRRSSAAYTGTGDLRDVRPFEAWMTDATWSVGIDVEPVVEFSNLDNASGYFLGAQGAFWVQDGLEVGGRLGYTGIDPDGVDGFSGLSGLSLYGRYRLDMGADSPDVGIGVLTRLPVGAEEVGGDRFDFLAFGAFRYQANEDVTFLGHAGIDSRDTGVDRDLGIALGGGAILPMTEELAAILELDLTTAIDYAVVVAGVDYELPPGGHLRAGLALGLDDAAPDAELRLGFSIPVY
jgi:hypothetical protein